MKNVLIVIFAVASVAFGGLCYKQWQTRQAAQAQLEATRAEAQQHAERAAAAKAAEERAAKDKSQLVKLSEDLGAELKAREESAKKAAAAAQKAAVLEVADSTEKKDSGKDFGKMISNMMKDPEMKKMIQGQQRMMMDQLYEPLIKKMGLSGDEADKLKNIVSENMMNATEKATSMFGSETNRAEMMKDMEADQKASQEKIKELLGPERFAQYEEYQQTLGERTQLNMFKQQFAGGDHPLTDVQSEQLLTIMGEEKKNLETTTGQKFPGSGADKASFEAILSEDQTEKLLEAQQTINQRVFDRANSVLQPEQMEAFGKFQTNQLSMMRMGIGMARKMMGGSSGSNPGS